jgi:hypothetical protein
MRCAEESYWICFVHPVVISGSFIVLLSVLAAADIRAAVQAMTTGQPPFTGNLETNQFTILVTTIAGFLSTILALAFQIWREGRNRAWDLEDKKIQRAENDAKLDRQTEELKRIAALEAELTRERSARATIQLQAAAENTTQAIRETEQAIGEKIDQNTQASLTAASEAEIVRQKLEHISAIISDAQPSAGRRIGRRAADQTLAKLVEAVDATREGAADESTRRKT